MLAVIFPGQGSQTIGMAKDFYDNFNIVKNYRSYVMRKIVHFIAGKDFEDSSENTASVFAPNTGEVQAEVSLANTSTLAYAIETAQAAQVEWAATNPQRRARVMFKFKELVEAQRETTRAINNMELTAGRGTITVAIEPPMAGLPLTTGVT